MRKVLLILLGIFCIASLVAEPFICENFTVEMFNELIANGPKGYVEPSISLGPYNATTGLNMVSKFYPRRNEGDELNYNGSLSSDATLNDGDKDYSNDHIIALGALYDVPLMYIYSEPTTETNINEDSAVISSEETDLGFSRTWYRTRTGIKTTKMQVAIISTETKPAMQFSANSSTDFVFVSQSHPTYRRPFELVIQPKYVTTDYNLTETHMGYTEGVLGCKIVGDDFDNNPSVELSSESNINYYYSDQYMPPFYASFWFDVILSMPNSGDIENGVLVTDKNGVQTRYELIEASDYSSVVDLAVRYSTLEHREGDSQKLLRLVDSCGRRACRRKSLSRFER